ncbi:protein kinase [Pyxidicoccus fallax]|uniref:Protein kinase n=1 Tax=Pyxidicoccus fallax TaxID=394095 RepID=A0A848L7K6_9BACT|nr:serine/threonine-protein kinase [Pyxidicoccus fallax]NMO14527.1 protein kinase [Pyxidicoccus fallax]NPC77046.1 protein kinase [Pyxidicoccus fallax]
MKEARRDAGARVLSPLALPEGTLVGRWRVERQVGQGGFGTVYAVREVDAPAGPLHALKLARQPEDAGFGREAEALRRVRHPGVVRLVEAGRWETEAAGYPYLVLEYVRGEGLYRWAWLRNPTARQVAGLLLQVAEALAAAHAQGVLHRDFKGGNVLVRGDGRLVVLDWGAGVHPQAAPLTRTGRIPPGTPAYYSPHVMAWRTRALGGGGGRYPYTEADEAYAVGVTFYRLLADEYPPLQLGWGEADAEQVTGAVAPQPLSRLNPRVPEALAALVMRLVAFQPEARPARMAALAEKVRGLLEAADAAWDAPLFEWYAGPGSHSRTTTGEDAWDPMAPGHEADLLRDRRQRPDVQANKAAERWLRRRHPQAVAVPAMDGVEPPAEEPGAIAVASIQAPEERHAPSEAPRTAEPMAQGAVPTRPGQRGRRWVEAVTMLTVVGLAGALAWERTRSPASRAEEGVSPKVAPATGLPHPAGTGTALASPPPPPHQEPPMPTPSTSPSSAPGLVSTLKRGVVACGAATALACSGAQVRPTPGAPCPDGALEAMRKLRLNRGRQVDIYVRTDKPGYPNEPLFVRDGEIVSRVFDSTSLPDGTLIEGRLWTQGKNVIGRYTALELPDGRRYPVCLVLCDLDGCTKYAESTPEAAAIGRTEFFTVVDYFP